MGGRRIARRRNWVVFGLVLVIGPIVGFIGFWLIVIAAARAAG